MPSVDELFGKGYEYGYHYSLKKIRKAPWMVGDDIFNNIPSGIERVGNFTFLDSEDSDYWNLIDTLFMKWNSSSDNDTSSIINDALLIKPAANKYTVNFDANGGSAISSKTDVEWADKVLSGISDPTKSEHFINGWKCVKLGDTELINPITVDKGTTYGDIMTALAEQTGNTTYAELAEDIIVKSFTLKAQYNQKIVPGTEPSDTEEPSDMDKTSETGDDMNIALLMTLLILSGCGIVGAGLYRRSYVK